MKPKYDHVTPLLQELHWFQIKFRPQYKIATFVCRFSMTLYQVIFSRPSVVMNQQETFVHCVRNSSCHTMFKKLCFCFLVSSVWNSVPADLRNSCNLLLFNSGMKIHLFIIAFHQQDFCNPPPPPPPHIHTYTQTKTPPTGNTEHILKCFLSAKI